MHFSHLVRLFLFLTVFFIKSCSRSAIRNSIDMNWEVVENSIDNEILLYRGYNSDVPLKGWAVKIPSKNNNIKIFVSEDEDGVSKPSEIVNGVLRW